MKQERKNRMLSDFEKGNNLMLTRLGPVTTLVAACLTSYWCGITLNIQYIVHNVK